MAFRRAKLVARIWEAAFVGVGPSESGAAPGVGARADGLCLLAQLHGLRNLAPAPARIATIPALSPPDARRAGGCLGWHGRHHGLTRVANKPSPEHPAGFELRPRPVQQVVADHAGLVPQRVVRRQGADVPPMPVEVEPAGSGRGAAGLEQRFRGPQRQRIQRELVPALQRAGRGPDPAAPAGHAGADGVLLAFAGTGGVALGAVMASHAGRWPDRVISVLMPLFHSIPGFWIGLMLIVVFSVKLDWLPSGGAETVGAGYAGLAALAARAPCMVLPGRSRSMFHLSLYGRFARAAILEVRSQDFVRTAAAKGLSGPAIMRRHVLRNAMLPITALAGVHLGGLLGGAVVVETVYIAGRASAGSLSRR